MCDLFLLAKFLFYGTDIAVNIFFQVVEFNSLVLHDVIFY